MNVEDDVKQQVRNFYDSVGWVEIGEGVYQNARYEDLRPVSREYIHRCHLRVSKHLPKTGKVLVDAGSGPIQYPEYLEYSRGFRYRLCLDISRRALVEARGRIGDHGLYVVGDIANLPFPADAFDALVSLHTVHHLPSEEHEQAFVEFLRVLRPGSRAVVVYSWGRYSSLMRLLGWPMALMKNLLRAYTRSRSGGRRRTSVTAQTDPMTLKLLQTPGTFTHKQDYRWMVSHIGHFPGFEIRVWRSVSPKFLRVFIHREAFGRLWLRALYWLEERAPLFFGRVGQYPMILFRKGGGISEAHRG